MGRTLPPLVEALVRARSENILVDAMAVCSPTTIGEAERVQAEVAERLGADIGGWKIGFAPDGETVTGAPIFRNDMLAPGERYSRGPAAFLAIEVEIGFRISGDVGGDADDSSLGAAFVGIEIVRSRFRQGPQAPFPSFLADNIANGAYVIGPECADWRGKGLGSLACKVWLDDECVHDARGGHPQGDPLFPFRALRNRPVERLGGIREGQFVTTGTLCGVMRLSRPCRVTADVEGFGEVSVDVVE